MKTLLERTRKINRLLQKAENVAYDSVAKVLSEVISANVYIVNIKGKIFGHAFIDDFECELMVEKVVQPGHFPKRYTDWLRKTGDTLPNLKSKTGNCAFSEDDLCTFHGKNTTIVPIYGMGEHIGSLIMAKYQVDFDEADLVLAEYGAAVVGMEMLRDRTRRIRAEERHRSAVHIALETLSFSEKRGAAKIFEMLVRGDDTSKRYWDDERSEGWVVASELVDESIPKKEQITRPVIVNMLRKLASAGLIESRSMGAKGTYIKVKNPFLLEELKKINPLEMSY